MTPAARLAAAIEILDDLARGDAPADAVAAHWFRGHRFAGSGDRRAIRELVYRDLRRGEMYRWALGEAGGDPESPRARVARAGRNPPEIAARAMRVVRLHGTYHFVYVKGVGVACVRKTRGGVCCAGSALRPYGAIFSSSYAWTVCEKKTPGHFEKSSAAQNALIGQRPLAGGN